MSRWLRYLAIVANGFLGVCFLLSAVHHGQSVDSIVIPLALAALSAFNAKAHYDRGGK
jgi:drug/metabolite transporter (DMT)-like permease